MPNALIHCPSAYLQQHAHDPINWQAWSPETLKSAIAQNRPIFLSVGYSSCHWCHVMGHESFTDPEVAQVLNEHFVSVKVDREEHPLVDEAFMTAVQLSSGHGGWPMTLFLTPDAKPFFAGTYFPKNDRPERMGFLTLAQKVADLWQAQPRQLKEAGDQFAAALAEAMATKLPRANRALDMDFVNRALGRLLETYDLRHGGFGSAPKFPPHSALALMLEYALSDLGDLETARRCSDAAGFTLLQMCLGGIHDHVGGGFHRYSVDREWHLPHFEKMLLDNALMIGNLARAERVIPSWGARFADARKRTIEWLDREMRLPNRLYASALDADSEGVEGKFYVWTEAELAHHLGDDFAQFSQAYGITAEGNFYDEATRALTGENLLHRVSESAPECRASLEKLLAIRAGRIRPMRDDKALVGLNALLASQFWIAGDHERAADLWETLTGSISDQVPRVIYGETAQGQATLEDAGALAYAESLIQPASSRFRDQLGAYLNRTGPGFVSSRESDEFLFARTIPVLDTPMPSGNALAILGLISQDPRRALELIHSVSGWISELPHATESLILGLLKGLETGQPGLFKRVNSATIELDPRPGTRLMIDGQEYGPGARIPCPSGAEIRYQICDDRQCGLPKTARIP